MEGNTGILAQLQDLSTAGAKDPILGVAQWIVTLLFFCIEILPVMVKVLLNIGPLSTYETLLKNEEDIITDRAKLTRVTRRRDAEREADKQIAIDEDMRQLEEDLGKKANKHVAEHMEAILDVALAEWSRQVQAKLGVQLPPGTLPGPAGSVGGQVCRPRRAGYGTPGKHSGTGAPGGTPVHVTGPQPRLSITGPQPVLGATAPSRRSMAAIPDPATTGQRERQREQRQRPGAEDHLPDASRQRVLAPRRRGRGPAVTADDPRAGSLGPFAALVDDDTESCLCLVVGYAKKDGLIARVTAEAERRVMMSPALGDFLQLRYVDLGLRPGQAGDRSRLVRRIVADLMAVQETAGRSHFALVVIAKSAMTVEELLGSCAAEPFLVGLRMRFVGIASSDDRDQGNDVMDITSSPAGSWRDERELVDALRQRCEELPRYFAARGEPGLTRAELAALRHAHIQAAAEGDDPEGEVGEAPDEAPVPDVLDDAPQDAALVECDSAPAESAAGRLSAIRARWLPGNPWRRGKQVAEADDPGAAATEVAARTAMGLVYLLMIVEQDTAVDPALGRLQAALLEVDKRLAAQPFCTYQVRVIRGSDDHLRGELQDAGKLGRRAAKQSVKTGDFTAVLKGIRGSLNRDRGLVQTTATAAGLTIVPPTVVFFAADPPIADLGAATVFADIAAEARVVWVVPGKLEGLVSPAFGAAGGAAVLGEHPAVADEILDLMHDGVSGSRA